tara:strand:+ start:7320 stop:7502 length:183 start_codon:yes stop_codon:yes gene_type:complete
MPCCKSKMSPKDHQKWRLRMLNFWRDRLEQRMAGIDASIATLVKQMERDEENTEDDEAVT